MPLPILQASTEPTPENLVRLFHRTELHWVRHVGEETQLDAGTAFTNTALPRIWDANGILDAALPDGATPEEAVSEVDRHYAQQGLRCRQWIMNPSASAGQTLPLVDFLASRGFRTDRYDVMHLAGRPAGLVREVGGLTIIPARASFRHARALAEEAAAEHGEPLLADASILHLDDPHWDALLALRDGVALGRVGVLAVGDVGRIEHVFVSAAARRQGVGRTLMSRAMEICARSLFRHVLLCVRPSNAPAITLYGQLGFRKVGEMRVYRDPG
jgi:ribosomal protein S18 acetylase RimI-like enzyme